MLKQGTKAKIVALNISNNKIRRRMCDLGVYSGQEVCVLRTSVLKKVVLMSIKNYALCIKKEIAESIEVNIE